VFTLVFLPLHRVNSFISNTAALSGSTEENYT